MLNGCSIRICLCLAFLLAYIVQCNDVARGARYEGFHQLERTATLTVKVVFDGEGSWRNASDGTFADWKFHRMMTYTVPLKGIKNMDSGSRPIDCEAPKCASWTLKFKRYLVFRSRQQLASDVPRACGMGATEVHDLAQGMAKGDLGMSPLVPFKRTIKGGGVFPSGDKSVTESDLCDVLVAIDNERHVMHLKIDGSDSTVKVQDWTNDLPPQSYSLPLQGRAFDASVMNKLIFTNLPIPEKTSAFEGRKIIERFNTVDGPDHTAFPLKATVDWRLVLDQVAD